MSLAKPTFTEFLTNRVYDTFLRSSHNVEPSSIPVIIDVDEKSLRQYGQWPWPRYRIAFLLDKLRELGATSISLDMLFAEDDRISVQVIENELFRDLGVKVEIRGIRPEFRNNDRSLADALSRGNVILGYQFLFERDSGSDDSLFHPLPLSRLRQGPREKEASPFLNASGVVGNLKILSRAAAGSGFLNASPDSDGILRRVPLIIEHRGIFYPSLGLASLLRSLDIHEVLLKTDGRGAHSLYLNKTAIPLTSRGDMLVRFRGKGKSFAYISAADILSGRIPQEKIQGKILFVGTSAAGLKEFKSTPLDPVFPGVEVHANVVDNILQKDFVSRPKWAPGLESLLVLGFGLLSAFILARTGAGWSSLLLGGMAAGVWQASASTFGSKGIFLSPVLPLMILGGNFSFMTFLKFWYAEKNARERDQELVKVQEATIESLSSLTETRDPNTGGHIKRTQNYIRLLAEALKDERGYREIFDTDTIDLLGKSAPLHDIGKVGVSDSILLKPGKLTPQEFEQMKQHTTYGRNAILSAERKLGNTSFLRLAREIVYTHHEKWDGSGYPEGLKGDQISIAGRLMALADTYDALISKRVYKSQLSHEQAVQVILQEKGLQFDPAVVDAFMKVKEDFRKVALDYKDSAEGSGWVDSTNLE